MNVIAIPLNRFVVRINRDPELFVAVMRLQGEDVTAPSTGDAMIRGWRPYRWTRDPADALMFTRMSDVSDFLESLPCHLAGEIVNLATEKKP